MPQGDEKTGNVEEALKDGDYAVLSDLGATNVL